MAQISDTTHVETFHMKLALWRVSFIRRRCELREADSVLFIDGKRKQSTVPAWQGVQQCSGNLQSWERMMKLALLFRHATEMNYATTGTRAIIALLCCTLSPPRSSGIPGHSPEKGWWNLLFLFDTRLKQTAQQRELGQSLRYFVVRWALSKLDVF